MMTQTITIRLIQDILRKNVAEQPHKLALICGNERLTYAQIDAASDRLAHALRRNGIVDGDRVLIYLMNSAELVISIFGVLKANAVFAAIDYANTVDSMRYIAGDCEAAALITYAGQAEAAAELLQHQPSMRAIVLTGALAERSDARLLLFQDILAHEAAERPQERVIDRDLAYLLYTSGSTGKAKGVMTTHKSSLFTTESGIDYFGLTANDILASPLQLSFSPGMNQLLKIFRTGGTLILEKSFAYPTMTLKRLAEERATAFAAVPTIITLLLNMDLKRYDLSALRYVSSVGSVLPPEVILRFRKKFPDIALFSFYGMAEAAYSLGLNPVDLDRYMASVGKPFPGTQAWIIDDDGHRISEPDQIGELVVRGSHVRSGYWRDPLLSSRRFQSGPLPGELVCHTGDIFRMDEDGYFYFIGRNDEIIKSGAKKVAPREIENVLGQFAGVVEAAAIGIPDPVLGQVIKAFVVLSEEAKNTVTSEDLLTYCHQTLEEHKIPRLVEIRDRLPKTPSGKIQKKDLT
jgi:long-chain acyl-CoA synthetase